MALERARRPGFIILLVLLVALATFLVGFVLTSIVIIIALFIAINLSLYIKSPGKPQRLLSKNGLSYLFYNRAAGVGLSNPIDTSADVYWDPALFAKTIELVANSDAADVIFVALAIIYVAKRGGKGLESRLKPLSRQARELISRSSLFCARVV